MFEKETNRWLSKLKLFYPIVQLELVKGLTLCGRAVLMKVGPGENLRNAPGVAGELTDEELQGKHR